MVGLKYLLAFGGSGKGKRGGVAAEEDDADASK